MDQLKGENCIHVLGPNSFRKVSVIGNRTTDMVVGGFWEGTYRLMDANADPNPRFLRLRSHALNELTLSERFG